MTHKRRVIISIMKMTERSRVKVVSAAFTGRSIPLIQPFRDQLAAQLTKDPETFGTFNVISKPSRPDWIIVFDRPCNEARLDELLKSVAQELKAEVFIDPGMPRQELTLEPRTFYRKIHPDAKPWG